MHVKSLNHITTSTWVITTLILTIFCSHLVITNPLAILALIVGIITALLFLKKPPLALAILIVLGINIFGAVNLGSLFSLRGLSLYSLVLLLFISISLLKSSFMKKEIISLPISYPIFALLLLTFGELVRSLVEGNELLFILSEARSIGSYLLFFIVISSLKKENEVFYFLKLLIIISVITSIVIFIQTVTGKLSGSWIVYHDKYNIYQSVNKGALLITFTFFVLFSGAIRDIKFVRMNTLILFLSLGAIILMLMRSYIISTLIGIIAIVILNIKKPKTIIRFLILIFLAFYFLVFSLSTALQCISGNESFLYILSDRFLSGYEDIMNMSGSFGQRTQMWQIRWDYIKKNNLLFGCGFKGMMSDKLALKTNLEKYSWEYKMNPTWAYHENILAFLLPRYGLSGVFVMMWLLSAVFYKAIYLYRKLPISWQKSLVCAILAFNIQATIASYVEASFFEHWALVILTPSWSMLVLIEKFYKQNNMEKVV